MWFSLNGATSSHSQPRVLLSGSRASFSSSQSVSEFTFSHLSFELASRRLGSTFPLGPHFRDYGLAQVICGHDLPSALISAVGVTSLMPAGANNCLRLHARPRKSCRCHCLHTHAKCLRACAPEGVTCQIKSGAKHLVAISRPASVVVNLNYSHRL